MNNINFNLLYDYLNSNISFNLLYDYLNSYFNLKLLWDHLILNMLLYIILFFILLYIGHVSNDSNFIRIMSSFGIITLVTWYGHYILHNNTIYNPIAIIHNYTHHSNSKYKILCKLIEYLIIEFIFFGGGIVFIIVLYIKYKYKFFILNPYIILYWIVILPIVHELYHYYDAECHNIHHKNTKVNYSPELWDIVMNTKCKKSELFKEYKMTPLFILMGFFIILFIKSKYNFIKLI